MHCLFRRSQRLVSQLCEYDALVDRVFGQRDTMNAKHRDQMWHTTNCEVDGLKHGYNVPSTITILANK